MFSETTQKTHVKKREYFGLGFWKSFFFEYSENGMFFFPVIGNVLSVLTLKLECSILSTWVSKSSLLNNRVILD